ncbi:MAG: DUF3572 domain-containing protein [Alphaproteobacteria bacterium]|nr:DUF3572 domain-containing protein [Alphaproteobacteria bacterium]
MSERALMFLVTRPPDLQRFLTASGLDAHELLNKADDKAILSATLSFLAADEELAKAFSAEDGLKPGVLATACAVLDPHSADTW